MFIFFTYLYSPRHLTHLSLLFNLALMSTLEIPPIETSELERLKQLKLF